MEWKELINKEAIFNNIITPLVLEASARQKDVYPRGKNIFRAFDLVPFDEVKVCIIGQDPYYIPGAADGLAFSVDPESHIPSSLKNIFQELEKDVGISLCTVGDLSSWAKQGVLLMNSVLTVADGQPGSHEGKGWEEVTGRVIYELSRREDPVIFVLWGQKALDLFKKNHCDNKHRADITFVAAHPSPQSANKGFFGCRHFSKINKRLEAMGKTPIDWRIK